MPDYNIYIHSDLSSSGSSPTKPWSKSKSSSTNPWDSDDNYSSNILKEVSKANGVIMNPDSLISTGIGALTKAVPWVALALVLVKSVDNVASFCINYNTLETGDYRDSIAFSNFKANMGWILKPFSTSWNELQAQNKYRVDNYKKDQQRSLLGDSVINTYTNRGV